ncbi:MAG: 50S ribosomal protein L25 [Clostridia bacterium]|nr:50S ribosomal protein L25 [Clostridia bacterium]NCC43568.1 50S ribosomal protein L25 [Clostridia bacterium]
MVTLKAEKRDMSVKAKALRRQGKVTGNISGKDLTATIPVQLNEADASRFLKEHSKGSQLMLDIEGEKMNVQLKDILYNPMKHQYDNIDFQALVAGETVTSSAQIILTNVDSVKGYLAQTLSEIAYKAIPSAMIEKIEIDMSKLSVGDKVLVGDLDIAKNKDIELITPADALIVQIAEQQKTEEDAPAAEEAPAEA